jgi:hypothetical protein
MEATGNHLRVDARRGTLTDVEQERLWIELEEVCAHLARTAAAGR